MPDTIVMKLTFDINYYVISIAHKVISTFFDLIHTLYLKYVNNILLYMYETMM